MQKLIVGIVLNPKLLEDSGNDSKGSIVLKAPNYWKRSNSPEVRINTFKNRRRGPHGGRGGRFRNNRRGRGACI